MAVIRCLVISVFSFHETYYICVHGALDKTQRESPSQGKGADNWLKSFYFGFPPTQSGNLPSPVLAP